VTAGEVLCALRELGVVVRSDGDHVVLDHPGFEIPPALLAEARRWKLHIIELVRVEAILVALIGPSTAPGCGDRAIVAVARSRLEALARGYADRGCTRCGGGGFEIGADGRPIVRPPEPGYPEGRLVLCWHEDDERPVDERARAVLDSNPDPDPSAWPEPMRSAIAAEKRRREEDHG